MERWLQIARASGERSPPRRQPRAIEITLPLLETLTAPTLLVAGAADLLAPPALMRLMAERIPNCVFATVAEAGHSAHWERAAEWNRIVLAFLRQQASPFLQRLRDEQPNGTVHHRFWQRGGGYDRNLTSAEALRAVIDYLHANPVRRGLVASAEDWEWSSARWYAGLQPVKLEMDQGVLAELASG